MSEENDLIKQRRDKLQLWRDESQAYPNTFRPENLAADIEAQFGELDKETLEAAALAEENVIRFIEEKTVRKVIVVPGKLVNVVAN